MEGRGQKRRSVVVLEVLDSISRTKGERTEVKRKGEERKEGEGDMEISQVQPLTALGHSAPAVGCGWVRSNPINHSLSKLS